MNDPIDRPRIPLKDVEAILFAKPITRGLYSRVRASWMEWLQSTGQPRMPISLSPGEEDAMDFIDYQLSDEEKEACTTWREAQAGHYEELANQVVHAGYRITFTYDEKNECVVVTLIGRTQSCPNYNKAMTTRHINIEKALMMALYKQVVVFDYETWGETSNEQLFG